MPLCDHTEASTCTERFNDRILVTIYGDTSLLSETLGASSIICRSARDNLSGWGCSGSAGPVAPNDLAARIQRYWRYLSDASSESMSAYSRLLQSRVAALSSEEQ